MGSGKSVLKQNQRKKTTKGLEENGGTTTNTAFTPVQLRDKKKSTTLSKGSRQDSMASTFDVNDHHTLDQNLAVFTNADRAQIMSSWNDVSDKESVLKDAFAESFATEDKLRVAFGVQNVHEVQLGLNSLFNVHMSNIKGFLDQLTAALIVDDQEKIGELALKVAKKHNDVNAPFEQQYFKILSLQLSHSIIGAAGGGNKQGATELRKLWVLFLGAICYEIRALMDSSKN